MKIFWMSCAECSCTQPMQPCEACPNYSAQLPRQYSK